MINNFSLRLANWLINKNILKKEQFSDFDYNFRIILFNCIMLFLLLTINGFLNTIPEMIILSVTLNIIKMQTDSKHLSNLESCIEFSTIYITILSIITKLTCNYTVFFILPVIILGMYIYIKEKYYTNKFLPCLLGFILIDFVFAIINIPITNMISNSINFGVIGGIIFLTNTGKCIFNKIDKLLYKINYVEELKKEEVIK